MTAHLGVCIGRRAIIPCRRDLEISEPTVGAVAYPQAQFSCGAVSKQFNRQCGLRLTIRVGKYAPSLDREFQLTHDWGAGLSADSYLPGNSFAVRCSRAGERNELNGVATVLRFFARKLNGRRYTASNVALS